MPAYFHSEQIDFYLNDQEKYKNWIAGRIKEEGKKVGDLNFIFTDNEYLLEFNRKYLNHNHYTDVITFNYSNTEMIAGDVYISVDQVRINSQDYCVDFISELSRVMIHGLLHLLGFNDSTEEEKILMRQMEDAALTALEM